MDFLQFPRSERKTAFLSEKLTMRQGGTLLQIIIHFSIFQYAPKKTHRASIKWRLEHNFLSGIASFPGKAFRLADDTITFQAFNNSFIFLDGFQNFPDAPTYVVISLVLEENGSFARRPSWIFSSQIF